MDTTPLRLGLIGVGHRSRVFATLNKGELSGLSATVVSVADPDLHAHDRARSWFGNNVRTYKHWDLLFAQEQLDGVIISTPDHLHAAPAILALERGIPTYLEKPIATSLDDADSILAAAHRTGTFLYVGHNMRHMAVVKTMRDVIAQGLIGEVKSIWCRHFVGNGGDFYFKDWHAERRNSYGLLLQKAAHDIDIIHHLAAAYTSRVVAMGRLTLYGQVDDHTPPAASETMSDWLAEETWPPLAQVGINPETDVEDLSLMLMQLENGVLASYEQCHYTPDYWRNYTVIGTEGRLENFGDGPGGTVRVWNTRNLGFGEADVTIPIEETGKGHLGADLAILSEWIEVLRNGGHTASTPLDARNAVAAGIYATDSLRNGSIPFDIPPFNPESA